VPKRPRCSSILLLWVALAAPSFGETLDQARIEALHLAIRLNQLTEVEKFADDKSYLNAPNAEGTTPLQEAIRYGYRRLYSFLLDSGVDVDVRDADNRTALHYAVQSREPLAVQRLIGALADVDAVDNYQYAPIHLAARKGNMKALRMLIAAGADINAEIDVGFTAVDLADRYPGVKDYLRAQGGKAMSELQMR